MPEFSLSERLENAHEEPIWAVTHVKDNIFATGSLDESVKLWWVRRLEYCCRYCPFCSRFAVNNSLIIALFTGSVSLVQEGMARFPFSLRTSWAVTA